MDIDKLNEKSIDNYIPKYYSYLGWAVSKNDIKSMEILLEKKANPNGITSNGLTLKIPLTNIDFRSSSFNVIIRLLLKKGADINQEDLRGHTILTLYFDFMFNTLNYQNEKFIDILYFLLERGANPNGTIFYNPLTMIVHSLNTIKPKYHGIVYKICEILIAYGSNPKFTSIVLNRWNDNIRRSALSLLNVYPKNSPVYKLLINLFNIKVDTLIKNCSSQTLLHSLSKFYKIPYDDETKSLSTKSLCDCIKTINNNKEEYKEDTFINVRKKIRVFNKQECSNEDLIIGSSVDSFPPNEIIYLKEKDPDLTFCFHISEIPMLLEKQRNPFNNRPLNSLFIEDLVTKYKYFLPTTLEETLEGVFNFKDTTINNKILLDKLGSYIKTFNSYIQPDKINELGLNDIIEIQNMLYGGNRDIIGAMINPIDRVGMLGESLNDTKKRIIERTITHLIIYIRDNEGSLPFVSNIVDQLIKDTETSKEIVSLFPRNRIYDIVNYARGVSYNIFIQTVDRFIIYGRGDVKLITTDKKFLNYLNDDQRSVIEYLDIKEIVELYRQYIKSSINEILKNRFGDMDLKVAWNDIVPSLVRRLND